MHEGGVRPAVGAALASIGFAALVIAGFGVTSLLVDAEVIAVDGIGAWPGAAGVAAATVAVAVVLAVALRAPHPGYGAALLAAPAALLAHLIVFVGTALLTGVDGARALSAAAGFAVSWFALILAGAASAAVWAGVALVRTDASRPQWPWERGDEAD